MFLIFFVLTIVLVPNVRAIPSDGIIPPSFTYRSGYWYDAWGITRDDAKGSDGYIPRLYSETTGINSELAFSIGEGFRSQNSDNNTMEAAILKYIQTWTKHGYDSDNVVMGGIPQEEWA